MQVFIMLGWMAPCRDPVQTVLSSDVILLQCVNKHAPNTKKSKKLNFRWPESTSEQGLWCLYIKWRSTVMMIQKNCTLCEHNMLRDTHSWLTQISSQACSDSEQRLENIPRVVFVSKTSSKTFLLVIKILKHLSTSTFLSSSLASCCSSCCSCWVELSRSRS